jgi:hypothetical protein
MNRFRKTAISEQRKRSRYLNNPNSEEVGSQFIRCRFVNFVLLEDSTRTQFPKVTGFIQRPRKDTR